MLNADSADIAESTLAFLSIDAAIDFHERLGGADLRSRNISLAADATALLTRCLNTEMGASDPFTAAMGLVRLPIAGPATPERVLELRGLMLDAGTDAPLHALANGIWLRISVQAYNELEDYEKLSALVARVIRNWE